MKLAFVIPRYQVRQAGGAEVLVQSLSERLAQLGHRVEVLTTCSEDHTLWKNDLSSGISQTNGVTVHRFPVNPRPNLKRFGLIQQRLERGWPINAKEEMAWIGGSVHSDRLYEALHHRKTEWDAIVFAPYLFGITYRGLEIAPEKSFLIPCLHNEPYAYLKIFQEMFRKPKKILFNSPPEKELGKTLFGLAEDRSAVVGMGFEDTPEGDPVLFRKKFKLGETPFLLYVGRREKGKNTPLLIDYFLTYKKHHPDPLKLVLLGSGPVDTQARISGNVMDLGFVSREEKYGAYRAATVTCQPSTNESFSIILMESWLCQTPVLVNEKCNVTRDLVARSGGGLWFKNYFEFEECLSTLLHDEKLSSRMGLLGRQYVLEHYPWNHVLNRFLEAVSSFNKKV